MMRTEPMREVAAALPWLEHFPIGGSQPVRTDVEDTPFTIGRNATCQLQVDSGRVSREHAQIVLQEGLYRVRDLGSTNGTFLNGERLEESVLHDGDLLVIADMEFSFCAGGGAMRATATQMIGKESGKPCALQGPAELVLGLRRLHETLVQRRLSSHLIPVVELESGLVFGYEAVPQLGAGGAGLLAAVDLLDSTECRMTSRLRQLHRLLVAEETTRHAGEPRFFVSLAPAEVGADSLLESLAKLRTLAADDGRLVVSVPDSTACDIPFFREFLNSLRNIGIGVSYENFSGGASQIAGHRDIPPDYLKLSRTLVSGAHRNRQRRRRLEEVARACQDLGCDVIATGISNSEEAAACRELGCRFAQGEYFEDGRKSGSPPPTRM